MASYSTIMELKSMLYPVSNTQKCVYCKEVSSYGGWEGLCNRRCYYGICQLLEDYEVGKVSEPDQRIVEYFTLYPSPSHSFNYEKIIHHIKNK